MVRPPGPREARPQGKLFVRTIQQSKAHGAKPPPTGRWIVRMRAR